HDSAPQNGTVFADFISHASSPLLFPCFGTRTISCGKGVGSILIQLLLRPTTSSRCGAHLQGRPKFFPEPLASQHDALIRALADISQVGVGQGISKQVTIRSLSCLRCLPKLLIYGMRGKPRVT